MKIRSLTLVSVSLLVSCCTAASNHNNGLPGSHQFHHHGDGELDVVNCHHTYYRVDQNGGKPELVSGQESRSDPSRQYLPPVPNKPVDPPSEEAPAASFEQPNVFTVEKTLVSPSLQKSYNSLFGKSFKPELLPAAAQNVPANALAPAVPKAVNKVTSDDDDPKYSLDRLCKDAFHSFLCKPITGPRRTPNGRLRPNAILPPDVLSAFSSSQDVTRVKPGNGAPAFPLPNPSNQQFQRVTFPPYSTTSKPTTRSYPAPFSTSKPFKPYVPEIPSPTNQNPQIISPEPSNEVPIQTAPQTNGYSYEKPLRPFPPQEPNPSNQNQQLVPLPTTPTPKPTQGYSYDKPNVPFPSNNVPQIAQPPHDCNQQKHNFPSVIANPSNDNLFFAKPTTKFYNNISTQKSYSFPTFPTTVTPVTQPKTTPSPIKPHDCSSHRFSVNSFISNPTVQNPYFTRTTSQPQTTAYEPPKVPQPSFNVAQIVAQPQQLNVVKTYPKQQGYVYEKPSIPFPPPVGNPSNNNPSFVSKPTQPPFTFQTTTLKPTSGYVYDQPRIPFSSNNIAQVISSQPSAVTTTTATSTPCQHNDHKPPTVGSPTNQNQVALRPDQTSNGYVYEIPKNPFPPEIARPSNQDFDKLKPFVTTTAKPTTGYFYNKPANPFLLPSQNNNVQNSIESANNGFIFQQKPNVQTQSGIVSSDNGGYKNSFNSISSTQSAPFDAIATAGYSYNQPKGPYPSSINDKLSEPSEEKLSFAPKNQAQVGNPYDVKQGQTFSHQASNQNSQFQPFTKQTSPYGR